MTVLAGDVNKMVVRWSSSQADSRSMCFTYRLCPIWDGDAILESEQHRKTTRRQAHPKDS